MSQNGRAGQIDGKRPSQVEEMGKENGTFVFCRVTRNTNGLFSFPSVTIVTCWCVMEQSFDDWSNVFMRLSEALDPYRARTAIKIYHPDGPQELSEPEETFANLYYYWAAAIVNSGDVFGYLDFIIEHKNEFARVGADSTLKALAELMPFYEEQQKLKNEDERNEYWRRTKVQRASAEALADGVFEFARVLLAFARQNLSLSDEA